MNLFQRGAAPSPAASFPSLTDVSPKLVDLNKRRDELSSERRTLFEESMALAASDEPEADPREQRVAALLGRSAGGSSSRTRRMEINQRIADIDVAVERLFREIQEEQGAASVRVCGQVRSEYQARVSAYFAALIAAHKANEALQRLIDDLESAGVRTTSIRFDFNNPLGSPWDRHSALAYALGEAASASFIDRADIPERFR